MKTFSLPPEWQERALGFRKESDYFSQRLDEGPSYAGS